MKTRGSKRQIAVSFKPFLAGVKPDRDNLYPAVVFGTQGLQLVTVDQGDKEQGSSSSSRKLRISSRKQVHALTAFSKKSNGSSNVAGAFLCADGRGEAIVFEVHLPNASPVGDPSPVVTKVTIHVEEHPHQRESTALPPPLAPLLQDTHWPSEASSPPLSCTTAESNDVGSSSGNGIAKGSMSGIAELGPGSGGGGGDDGEKARPKSVAVPSKGLSVGLFRIDPMLKTVHGRRRSNSLRPIHGGSLAGEVLEGRLPPKKPSGGSTSSRSPTDAKPPRNGGVDNVDDERQQQQQQQQQQLSEDEDLSSDGGMGAFEGLKWGEYVQFKMPAEGQTKPDDQLLTLRLSNGYTATLTSEQLRENAGLGKFPVKATKIRGARESSEDPPGGNGVVFLRCTLTPIACPGADKAAAAAAADAATDEREEGAGRLVLPQFLRALLLQKEGGAAKSAPSKHIDTGVVKPSTSSTSIWAWVMNSALLSLVLAVAFLTTSAVRRSSPPSSPSSPVPMPATSHLSRLSRRSLSTPAGSDSEITTASSSPSPSPCTSVWDLRRSDGTAYPHSQLSAAAAALGGDDSGPPPDGFKENEASRGRGQQQQLPQQGGDAGGSRAARRRGKGDAGSESARRSGSRSGGEGAHSAASTTTTTTAEVAGWAPAAAVPKGEGGGVGRGLAGGGGGSAGEEGARGYGGGGVGLDTVVGSIGLAALAVVVVMKGLFGIGNASPSPSAPAPSLPMQAQVYLLGWDGRRLSEAAGSTEDIDNLYYPPPSGSTLPPMPHRFLLAESMDVAKAWARWEATIAWRKESGADNILNKPHPRFSLIKSKYAHCFHLTDGGGRVTYYERPGMSEIADLKRLGISKADLLDHYVYCMEYLWQVLQPRQSQRITIIIDLAGVKFRDLVGESLAFLKTSVGMMSKHYPQRSFKIMILNAPSFFNSVFALVKPMLNEATKKKIDLLPVANAGAEMLKVIPAEHLPVRYGGTGEEALGESPAERSMLAHVQKVLEENGQMMEKPP
ncbi:unnamed protein product [Pylaiella littoralis]